MPGCQGEETGPGSAKAGVPKSLPNTAQKRNIFICQALFYSSTLWVHMIDCLGMFATCESIPGAVKQEYETTVFLYWYNFTSSLIF